MSDSTCFYTFQYYVNCSPLSKLYFYNINTLKDIK